jgi:LysM repeat protein
VRQIPTGMLLRIPVPSPKGQAAYLVSTGETLYGIAGSLGMTVEQIAHLNAIAPPYHLTIGQYLMLIP